MHRILAVLIIIFSFSNFQQLQAQIISGKVTDEAGDAIPGVTIFLKGTTQGTVTDIEGNYRLNASPDDVIVYSYIGFLTQEIAVGSQSTIDVTLSEDATELNEVIITGYSSQKKKDIIGSIASIEAEDIQGIALTGMDQALQGKAAGVQVTQSSGTPGGGITVRVRGSTSISASNRPLFIIDGVPVETGALALRSFGGQNDNALATLNPNDIESFQVLKDASAKAIYGSRAANGVVLITTKRGQSEQTSFNLDVQRGIIDITNKVELLNAEQLLELQREALVNAGRDPDESGLIAGVTDQINTDWLDEILRQGIMEQYQLSVSGGSRSTKYYTSLAYRREEGIQLNNQFERFSATINVDHKASEKFSFGTNLMLSRIVNNRVKGDNFLDGVYSGAIKSLPYYYPYDEFGRIIGPNNPAYAGFPNFNPVGQAILPRFETTALKILGGIYGEYQILENLKFRSKISVDYNNVVEDQFEPSNTAIGGFLESVGGQGYGVYSTGIYATVVNSNVLTYNTTIGNNHNLNVLFGTEFLQSTNRSSNVQGRLFPSDDFTYITSAGIVDAGSSFFIQNGLNSYFTEIKYDNTDRFFLSVSGRYDGSSRFGENNQFGFFPSFSAGWRMTRESFIEPLGIFDDLKLRTSYGFTGNERIGDFQFLGTFAATTYNGASGTGPSNLENPDLKWERTREFNAGIDMSFLAGRLQASFDYYDNLTDDLLFDEPIPFTTGFGSLQGNIGNISNKGMELAITSINMDDQLKWSTTFNISRNINEVVSLADTLPIFSGFSASGVGNTNIVKEGEPLGTFWGLEFLGVDPATGDALYDDTNLDGQITADDAKILGNAQPDFIGGITNNLQYGPFDLSIFFQFSYGNDMLNLSNTGLLNAGEDLNYNQVIKALDRWRQPGDITDVPRYEAENTRNNWHSSRFIEDASFLRLKNVSIGYTLPDRLLNKYFVQSARVYASATNLWTLTSYTGGDPEISSIDGSTTAQGIDFFTLPQVRTIMVGLNVKF